MQNHSRRELAASPPKPKTIMFFDHTASLGGGEISLLHLVQHIDRQRFEPVVVLSSDGPLRTRLQSSGVETHVLPLSSAILETRKDSLGGRTLLRLGSVLHTLLYVRRLARFIKKRRADIVHTNSLKADVIGGLAGRQARVPVVWHVRDRITHDYLPDPVARAFRWLCRVVPDYIIANSASTLDTLKLPKQEPALVVYSGIVEKNVSVVHDGVVPLPTVDDRKVVATPLIGLVGRITEWKGQHIFIEAAARVCEHFPAARFQIIGAALFGETDYEAQIRTQVQSLGLDNCIEFTGFRTDVPILLQKLDILVHASTTGEPFGQVIVEGMVAGRPVVATAGGGVPEIVQDGISGLLVPMGDAQAMADAVVELLRDPQRAAAMGRAGRKRVQDHFTIEHTVRKVQLVYDEVTAHYRPQSLIARWLYGSRRYLTHYVRAEQPR